MAQEVRAAAGRAARRCQQLVRAQELADVKRAHGRVVAVAVIVVLRRRAEREAVERTAATAAQLRAQLVRHAEHQLRRKLGRLLEPAQAQLAHGGAQLREDLGYLGVLQVAHSAAKCES